MGVPAGPPPGGPPSGGTPQEGGQAPDPAQVEQGLVKMLQQARQVAQEHQLDFDSIVAASGGGGPPSPQPPG